MICRQTPVALFAFAAGIAFVSCGGGRQGRPTLPPPDYEMPNAGPDASASSPAPAAPGPANPGPAPSAAPAPGG